MMFAQAVYRALRGVPRGNVTTYGALARAVGSPRAARAVGRALRENPTPSRVPCHRVVRADGLVGGYAWGTRRKISLLRGEGVKVEEGRVPRQYVITVF
ncbi:MGMT family protein [Candidatus Uhrbacteria bacterium]|nr:MGMT family protein [Candidatus Uhrbacteria bacterium]